MVPAGDRRTRRGHGRRGWIPIGAAHAEYAGAGNGSATPRPALIAHGGLSGGGGSIRSVTAPFSPDERQALVLEHGSGTLLVTGPSGTGKTAVLRERFARLIEQGADPDRVALVVGSSSARERARAALPMRFRW